MSVPGAVAGARVLVELRPALDGHAGIPQAARLLFRGLARVAELEVEGLIQSSGHVLARGLPGESDDLAPDRRVNRLSRVVISLQQRLGNPYAHAALMAARRLLGAREALTRFDPEHFRDFVWRRLFARTLPPEDFDAVTGARFRVARVPWTAMHRAALATRLVGGPFYPHLDTAGFDLMVAETPYPASVAPGTQLVVRYHDAIPLLMPHTIAERPFHQASHYHALRHNVREGAWFACVSEATRRDLLSVFPEAGPRTVTIPNMVSHHYHAQPSPAERVPDILWNRLHDGIYVPQGGEAKPTAALRAGSLPGPDYLLIVSTIEPRKNHATLLAAWEQLRVARFPGLKLVVVGMLGWEHEAIVRKFRPWIDRGELFVLQDVPAGELRILYRHARATICPSLGEGFDFSGVEAMRCGGAVVASDIPVHREVFDDAAEFFGPYSADDLEAAIARVIDPAQGARREALVLRGAQVSQRYAHEAIVPLWRDFLLARVRERRA